MLCLNLLTTVKIALKYSVNIQIVNFLHDNRNNDSNNNEADTNNTKTNSSNIYTSKEQEIKDLLAFINDRFNETAGFCKTRWDRDIVNMFSMVTGANIGLDALFPEDVILQTLYTERKQLAESILHEMKSKFDNNDVHFESYFYDSIRFGLPEEREAHKDGSRLNYTGLDRSELKSKLNANYTLTKILEIVKSRIFNSTVNGSQLKREKLINWLRANRPEGYGCWFYSSSSRSSSASSSSDNNALLTESWIYDECFDEDYIIRDSALIFMLCKMRILKIKKSALLKL
eukprot:Awhi_evm2s7151